MYYKIILKTRLFFLLALVLSTFTACANFHPQKMDAQHVFDINQSSDVEYLSNDSLWQEIQKISAFPDVQQDDFVQNRLAWYARTPLSLQKMMEQASPYLFHVVQELKQRQLPGELALLPFVESAYNPQALSSAQAAGIWQFIPSTGKVYNLKQTMFSDARKDILASTSAALDYLNKLYQLFGDWYLALAAYNWGEGNVQKAIERNRKKGLATDYLHLKLPKETRAYIPKLLALKKIIADPQKYGIVLPAIPNHPYFVQVDLSEDIDIDVAADLAELSVEEFKKLNPAFHQPVIPTALHHKILLPFDRAELFLKNLKEYPHSLSSWTTYTLSKHKNPDDLAQQLSIDVALLRKINQIPPQMRVRAGSTVLIPIPKTGPLRSNRSDIKAEIAEFGILKIEQEPAKTMHIKVVVRTHDTLEKIARRYGVTVKQIQTWNHIKGHLVKRGQTLVLTVSTAKPEGKKAIYQIQKNPKGKLAANAKT